MSELKVNVYDPAKHYELMQKIFFQQEAIIKDIKLIKEKNSDYYIDPNRYYTTVETADLLNINAQTLSNKCSDGGYIPYSKSNNSPNSPRKFLGADIIKSLEKDRCVSASDAKEKKRVEQQKKV